MSQGYDLTTFQFINLQGKTSDKVEVWRGWYPGLSINNLKAYIKIRKH